MGRRALTAAAAIALGSALLGCGEDDSSSGDGEAPAPPAELAIYDWEGSLVTERPFLAESSAREAGGKGAVVVRDPEPEGSSRSQFFALRDDPAVTTDDVASASAEAGAAGEPTVNLELTTEGQRRFEALTREVSSFAKAAKPTGPGPVVGPGRAGHIAIVVDGDLLALPAINPVEFPEGISGEQGIQISGGLTQEEAEELAEGLRD